MYEPDLPIGRIGGLAAVLVLLLTTASCKDGNAEEEKAAEEAAVPVEVQAIDRGDVAAVYSGTAALEALLAKRPMVVGYRIAPLTHFIVKRFGLLKVDRYSLPNVLANVRLVPELMQNDCTPEKLAAALLPYFTDPSVEAALQPRYRSIHESLRRNASVEAANAVAELLREPR